MKRRTKSIAERADLAARRQFKDRQTSPSRDLALAWFRYGYVQGMRAARRVRK